MNQLDDALLTALRVARPDPGYQPSPASAEATAMVTRILSTHPDRDRSPRPGRLDRTALEARPSSLWLRWVRRRPARLIAGAVAAAAAAVAAIVVPAVAPGTAGQSFAGKAWAVEWHGDGTVNVTLDPSSFKDLAGLQRALRADGIMAYVTRGSFKIRVAGGNYHFSESCYFDPADDASPAVQKAVVTSNRMLNADSNSRSAAIWTIRPAAMPAGSALLIVGGTIPQTPGSSYALLPVVLRHARMPACIPNRN